MTRPGEKKWAGLARRFKTSVAATPLQEIRDGLGEFIKQAATDKDVDTLALLAGWFVLASDEVTIERFKNWMETAIFIAKQEPPSNGKT